MSTKKLLASFALASLVAAQPVAAATRSYESLPVSGVQSVQPVERMGSIADDAESVKGRTFWILLVGGIIVVILLLLSGSDSPG